MPMMVQGELSEGGDVLLSSVRVVPIISCMDCDECKAAEMDGEDMPLSCARFGEPMPCTDEEQSRSLAIRLHLIILKKIE